MKGKLILLTVLFLLFIGFVVVQFFILDSTNTEGQVKVTSSPDSTVFLDNVALGKTPYEGKSKAGEHELKLIPVGDATSTASFAHRIAIEKNTLTFVNVELGSSDVTTAAEIFSVKKMSGKPQKADTGEIEVETDPAGAIVSLDNEEKGTASVILSEVLQGTHELSVSLPTFFPRTQKVNVEPGYRVNAFFKLAVDQGQQDKRKELQKKVDEKNKQASGTSQKKTIQINQTTTGWLRVRDEASVAGQEVAKVDPDQEFEVLDEQSGWYKIEYEKGKQGWVSSEFVTVISGTTPTPSVKESTKSAT